MCRKYKEIMTENQSKIEYFFFQKEAFNCFSIAFITDLYNILPPSMHCIMDAQGDKMKDAV